MFAIVCLLIRFCGFIYWSNIVKVCESINQLMIKKLNKRRNE